MFYKGVVMQLRKINSINCWFLSSLYINKFQGCEPVYLINRRGLGGVGK